MTATAMMLVSMMVVAGSAWAVPDYLWRSGEFTRADVPVYERSVDGWWCHWFGICRDADRDRDDPQPVGRSDAAGQRVQIECRLGAYDKLAAPTVGWALAVDVRESATPVRCYAGDF